MSHKECVCVCVFVDLRRTVQKVGGGSERVLVKEVIPRDEGTASKGKESQEGHSDRCTRHLREIVFSPVCNPVVNTSPCRG